MVRRAKAKRRKVTRQASGPDFGALILGLVRFWPLLVGALGLIGSWYSLKGDVKAMNQSDASQSIQLRRMEDKLDRLADRVAWQERGVPGPRPPE